MATDARHWALVALEHLTDASLTAEEVCGGWVVRQGWMESEINTSTISERQKTEEEVQTFANLFMVLFSQGGGGKFIH